jgi:hypothetical protein
MGHAAGLTPKRRWHQQAPAILAGLGALALALSALALATALQERAADERLALSAPPPPAGPAAPR